MSNSLRPHGLQHVRLTCPSPTPGAYSNSCPLSQWCHPTISSSVIPFSSCLPFFPASGSFLVSQLFTWGGQNTGSGTLSDQSVKFGHTIVVLETNPCNVLGFLDQLKSNNGVPFISKATQQWADSLGICGPYVLPNHPQAWSTVECWNSSSKISSKRFLAPPPGPHTSVQRFSHYGTTSSRPCPS